MEEKKGLFARLLQLITYTEKQKPREFVIPEVDQLRNNGGSDAGDSKESKDSESKKEKVEKQSKNNDRSTIKKPLTVEELKAGTADKQKEKNEKSSDKADMNIVSTDIDSNMDFLKDAFNFPVNKDIVIREFRTSNDDRAFVAFIDGMADRSAIDAFILRPLMNFHMEDSIKDSKANKDSKDNKDNKENKENKENKDNKDSKVKGAKNCTLDYIHDYILEINQTRKVFDQKDAIFEIMMGDSVLYIDGCDFYITCETKGFDKRSVDKPLTESVVKGPQQGFNENLKTNITLMRRIIKNSSLTTEYLKVGKRSNTLCAVVYIKDIINPAIVEEVKRRINNVSTDFVGSAGMLEQLLEDNPDSIMPTILTTERPDRAASHLFEGKVAILVDGTPFTMIVPVTFHSLMHSPEDAALKWQVASSMRLIRLIALGIATFLPGMYIAITTFHREMIPTDILIAIAKAKENVPFPSVVEIILMEISFELIREAGVRIPGIIGSTIGIIGALILGQAAVQANLVSPVLIIVIAVTGLGNYSIPNFSLASSVRLLRFAYILAGAFLGFYGIALGIIMLMVSLVSHKSFGVPYLAPIAPKTRTSRDVILRWPIWVQELRPDYVNPLDVRRQPEISRKWAQQDPGREDGNKGNG